MAEERVPPWYRLRAALRNPHIRSLVAALVVLALLLLAWWQSFLWYERLLLSEFKAQAALRASLRGNALSLSIGRRFALVHGLRAYVQTAARAPGLEAGFQAFAAELYEVPSAWGVRNIALAPDGIVCCVYPLVDNEAMIGYVPLDDPRPQIRQDVERAITTGEIILSGPVDLVQDGMGLVAYQAVYLPPESGQADVYWGLVDVVLDLSTLLDESALDVQTDITLDYALRDGAGNVFYGDQRIFDQDPVIYLISLPEGVWELAGAPDGGWQAAVRRPLLIFQLAGLTIAVLSAGLVYLSVRRQTELALAYTRQKTITEQNLRLHEQAERLAVLEERQRIARELHDSVSQALYGIGLGARTARALLERDPDQAVEPVEYILSLAEGGLAEMRALILELHPDSLEREGLVSALGKQAASLQARHGLEVEAALGKEPELPLEVKEGLYRIAQEALNNTVKHAQASRVVIRLEESSDEILLLVQDDGIGFDPQDRYPGHMGLHTMQERAEKMGGTFHIESASGRGTRLQVTLSLAGGQ